MLTFSELYERIVKNTLTNENNLNNLPEYNPYHLDCLLHPEKYPIVWNLGECAEKSCGHCKDSCIFNAIIPDGQGGYTIDPENCNGCGACIEACKRKNIISSKDVLPALNAVKQADTPVYALIAPSFLGQFSNDVTPGKLRNAFKKLGFHGMLEVALFADILTLKEALEFDKNIVTESDYQLTSCCCPLWIAMIRKIYKELMPHVPGSVSPMIASGRTVKYLHSDAVTIFIGPCLAKKAEAREPDIAGSVDYVLTFQEMQEIFDFAGIDPSALEDSEKDHSSRAGRIYGYSGGVSEAVQSTLEKINPNRNISIHTRQADGVPACREMINELKNGAATANFFEGMGCKGGCAGGPKVVIDVNEARQNIIRYGAAATYETPIDNPYVIELLHRLGFDTVEALLEKSDIFTRTFG